MTERERLEAEFCRDLRRALLMMVAVCEKFEKLYRGGQDEEPVSVASQTRR